MRALVGLVLAAALMSGCAGWTSTPYNAREGSGGTYESNGTCWAGLE